MIDTATSAKLAPVSDAQALTSLDAIFAAQRADFRAAGTPTLEERANLLGALAGMVMAHRRPIQDAMIADFGVHATQLTDLTEVLGVAGQAQYVLENLAE